MENGDGLGYGYGSRYDGAKRAFGRMNRQIKAGGYGWAPLVSAVVSCAGPAAELRFRREVGSPARLLWATIGDHESVDGIGKLLEDRHGRDSFAFRRLAWRTAWRLMHRPEVWSAVSELAFILHDGMSGPRSRERKPTPCRERLSGRLCAGATAPPAPTRVCARISSRRHSIDPRGNTAPEVAETRGRLCHCILDAT
jgi:hypothetical protein